MVGFTKTLAVDLAHYDITVNCILPGYIHTPGVERAARLTNPDDPQASRPRPTACLCTVSACRGVGYLAAFLASDAYITALSLSLTAGIHC